MTDKQSKLDQLKQKLLEDKICPDLASQATQLVFGDGSADADVVFIGEAPGKNEDIQGLPFVGAAGKFLDEMLEVAELKRSEVYITNIVKYRPPNNRDPLPEEKKAFWPYLVRQLDIIKPKLVVTLGRHSMEYFLPSQKISQIHGEPKRIRIEDRKLGIGDGGEAEKSSISGPGSPVWKLVVLPLFHPAAALYNGGMKQTLIDDFARIPVVLEKIKVSNKEN